MVTWSWNPKNSVPKISVELQQVTPVNTIYEDEPHIPSVPGRCVTKQIRKQSRRSHVET